MGSGVGCWEAGDGGSAAAHGTMPALALSCSTGLAVVLFLLAVSSLFSVTVLRGTAMPSPFTGQSTGVVFPVVQR